MAEFPDHASLANLGFIEDEYRRYLENPESVDVSWRHFFEGIDFASFLYRRPVEGGAGSESLRIQELIQAYRRYGHLSAPINPLIQNSKPVLELGLERLGFAETELDKPFPTLGFCGSDTASLREIIAALQEIYSSRIGFEYMDLGNPEMEKWMQERLEPKLVLDLTVEEKHLLLEYLNKSEVFEKFLNTRYVGQTRFSIEGTETAIPMLAEIIERGSEENIEELWIGMAHRGRLNVLANILEKPYSMILEEFEDDTTLSFFGNDDVKYHVGFTGEFSTRNGKKVLVGFPANPSHLESVDPVLLGQTRARQVLKNDADGRRIIPLLIHGDAALAGQGVVYESMQLMRLPDYSVGGTIHLVLNNQIGYTTLPEEGRSTRYATDIAKAFGVPVLHVNAEDPESCLFAAKLAVDIRQKFQCDVFLDLIGYRKYGHNEGDEPSYTQPVQYKLIRSKKSIREIYLEQLAAAGILEQKIAETLEAEFKATMSEALAVAQAKEKKTPPKPPAAELLRTEKTGAGQEILEEVLKKFCHEPEGFHHHPKLQKWLENRLKMAQGNVDWATAEALSIGSMLLEKTAVRLAGQDARRGTFSQRHMIWADAENGSLYCPLCKMREGQGRFDVVNSPLTEYAGLGFEYGYSVGAPDALVLWEAQYGDFDNGAQIIIDQYIASAEQKWGASSSIVLLLPHGSEGAGPEHSSARLERFLQLSANDNMLIVNASTPAQYFHLLRRQVKRKAKKPLIVFTPKSLLRASACVSPFKECIDGSFQEVLDDALAPVDAERVLLCSGKVYYDLIAEREKRKKAGPAILRLEQIYPLHVEKLKKIIGKYRMMKECVWVQEEPENMGAWSYIAPKLAENLQNGVVLSKVSRPESPSPATGSKARYVQEQKTLIDAALGE
jgi:2-oxoglutarate dehydrogenase E1 component